MPNAFFLEPENLNGNSFSLDENESHHTSHVFRLRPGDTITLLDGKGCGYEGVIEEDDGGIIRGRIERELENLGENNNKIIIAPALLKRDRFESLIEKSTELGVYEIHPILTERCIKRTINLERCQKIVLSSAKQCQRSHFPIIREPKGIIPWLNKPKEQCLAGVMGTTKQLKDFQFNKSLSVNVLIGPEGDFSNEELDHMKDNGVKLFSLGNRRLRADTAAQASLSILNELLA